MIDKFIKLVAVAEAMATSRGLAQMPVDGVSVLVEGDQGCIKLGEYGVLHTYFAHDENVWMPEYGVCYTYYEYNWVDGKWKVEEPRVREQVPMVDESIDDLPF